MVGKKPGRAKGIKETKPRKRTKPKSTLGIVKGMYWDRRDPGASTDRRFGNRWWERRAKHGPDVLFGDPAKLWEAAVNYFEYVDENPWEDEKVFVNQGIVTRASEYRKQVYTMAGLQLFLGVSGVYFYQLKERVKTPGSQLDKGLAKVIEAIELVIYSQKYAGATSGFFNANIIARDLGLKDATDVTTGGQPFQSVLPAINVYNTAPPLANSEAEIGEPDKVVKQLKK